MFRTYVIKNLLLPEVHSDPSTIFELFDCRFNVYKTISYVLFDVGGEFASSMLMIRLLKEEPAL
jgi:hypothetical protein